MTDKLMVRAQNQFTRIK